MAGAVTKPQHLQRGITQMWQVKYFICLSPYFCITLNVPLYTSEEETPDNNSQIQPVAWIFRL